MLITLWIVGFCLLVVMFLAASANLGMRTRSILAVSEHLEQVGRESELRWLTRSREKLALATALVRATASLALVLVIVDLCERYELAYGARIVLSFVLSLVLVMVFGVAIPSAFAKYAAGQVIATSLPVLKVVYVVSAPVLFALNTIDGIVRRLAGVSEDEIADQSESVERELLNVVSEGELRGAVDEHEKELIESAIEFGEIDVETIMTPRTEIVAIDKAAGFAEAKELIRVEGHSRIPVYEETIDRIIGVLYAKDLLQVSDPDAFDMVEIMRTVPFIPNNKLVRELLQELKDRKVHMAIVLDEYGGTSGLATIEDILEELVGEIEDEYEASEPEPIERIDDNTVDVDARMRIDELNDDLNLSLPEHDDYETIGGFVFSSLGRIPRVGESCEHGPVRIDVVAAEPRKINRLRLHISSPRDANGDQAKS